MTYSSEEYVLTDYDLSIIRWGDAMAGISMIIGLILPIAFYRLRHEPLIALRIPFVVSYEIFMNMVLLFIIATQYGSFFDLIWGPVPCFIQNALSIGTNVFVLSISLCRVLVFYRTAQANVMETPKYPGIDKIIHYLGIMLCPREFQRLELRIKLLDEQKRESSVNFSVITEPSADNLAEEKFLRQHTSGFGTLGSFNRQTKETIAWVCKMTAWFFFWCVIEFALTYPVDGPVVFRPNAEVFEVCSLTSITFIGVVLIIWCAIQLSIVLTCINWINDAYGLKVELIIAQIFFSLIWGANGFIQAIAPQIYNDTGVWTDLSVILINALFTYSYPVALLMRRKRAENAVKKEGRFHLKTVDDLIKLWSSEPGRSKIMEICSKRFALENALFLVESEDPKISTSAKKLEHLYQKYFLRDSPFELNLPVKILGNEKEKKFEVVVAARKHIFHIVFTNFKDDIELAFAEIMNNSDIHIVKSSAVAV